MSFVSCGFHGGRADRVRVQSGPACWEIDGYHDYGDPWREQRYSGA